MNTAPTKKTTSKPAAKSTAKPVTKSASASSPRRAARHEKSINIALQGGGAHGAFTWGVLDRLFEDDRIWVEAISGTSAGAMNAVVAAQGMFDGGAEGARESLRSFWRSVSEAASGSPYRRIPSAIMAGDWSLKASPSYVFFDLLSRMVSPYEMNPFDINPLRKLVGELIDFEKVRACQDMHIFIAATNVETGRVRVFSRDEMELDAVMASACLPSMFKAVEIDGVPYWDGGFMGNPPLFPFFHGSPSNDIVIVQINPVFRAGAPKTAKDIQNRLNEITFNGSLLHELRSIDFVTRLIEDGKLDPSEYKKMHLHIIQSRKRMRELDASSKLNAEWDFLQHLFEIGRDVAGKWLKAHFHDLGERSSVDIRQMFTGVGVLPHHHADAV
ncbi:MAG: patatin-like phospholipase family protein [Alphaproteobacteria bacterium]|nr:patatin-like phospholipase family protein [Alphaproteobacteria bacterium]